MNKSLYLSARILKVYIEALVGFSQVFSPGGLNTLPSQSCIPETVSTVGMMGRRYIPRSGEGVRSLQLLGSSLSVNWSCPFNALL